jgi:tRNA 2-thiouridine synthesizing protein A
LDHYIDAMGEMCPMPIIRAEISLLKLKPKERVIVKTDHSCSTSSVTGHFKSKYNYHCEVVQVDYGIWEIMIEKSS